MSNKRKLMEDPEEEMDQPEEGCRSEQRQSRQPNLTTRPTTGHSEPVTGEQLSCTHPNPTTPQNTHRTGPTFNVEVTLTVGPPTEEVRREIKGFLALRIADAELPLTTTSVPVRIVGGGRILLVCDDEGTKAQRALWRSCSGQGWHYSRNWTCSATLRVRRTSPT